MKNFFEKNFACFLILTTLFLGSCSQGIYSPINEVMHSTSSKGELELGLNFNHSSSSKIQSSLSYSPINNIGLSYSNISSNGLKSNSLAIGYYTNNNVKKEFSKTFYDFYLGACLAKHFDFFQDYDNNGYFLDYEIQGLYTKLFTQVGYHTITKRSRFDLVAKLNFVDWSKITVFGNVDYVLAAEELRINEPYIFVELNPKFSFGPEFYKLNVGGNWQIGGETIPEFNRLIIYTGVSINLNNIFKKGILSGQL